MTQAAPPPARRLNGLLRQLVRHISWRSATLWLAIVANLLLIGLYVWSRSGSTVSVRIEAIGRTYRAYVDGQLVAEGGLLGPAEGGIGVALRPKNAVPSIPQPSGVDWIRVTDAATQEVLFEDSFSSRLDIWQEEGGDWATEDGVLTAGTRGVISTGPQPWTDYVVEAKLRNATEASFYVRFQDSRNAVIFSLRPFRHYDTSLAVLQDGATASAIRGSGLHLDRGETIRSIAAMLLRPYPTILLIIVGVTALAFLVRVVPLEQGLLAFGRLLLHESRAVVFALALSALILLWYINFFIAEAMPHVPDSVWYIFQSKIFASFRLTADAPPVRESFSIFRPFMDQVVDGRWFSHYPFGHPLFLAVGQLIHAPWLIPPLLGALSIGLIYGLGQKVYGTAVGIIAAALLLFSPFFQMTASNFMSHNTAVFTILATMFLMAVPTRFRLPAMFFSGVFLGLLFNMRPLTAVTWIPVLGVFLAYELARRPERKRRLIEDLAFGAGGALMLGAYFLYNKATTGDFVQSPYALQGTYTSDTFGFGGRHSVAVGLQNQQELLAFTLLVANGWPAAVGFGLAAVPFITGSRQRWDVFLAASFLAIAATTMYYQSAAVMHGPRFWYETLPFLILLTARGAHRLAERASALGDWLAARFRWRPEVSSAGVAGFAVYSLVAALVALSAWGWMLGRREAWPGIAFVPDQIADLKGFNFTDGRLLDTAERLDLENALVLVEPCSQWWCFGSVFWTNSPDLDSNVVWAERQGNQDDLRLLEHYRGRSLYLANYDQGTIVPTTQAHILSLMRESPSGPAITARERDELRRRHLAAVEQALERYVQREGTYPTTNNLPQTLCAYQDLDAGCQLGSVLAEFPREPLGAPRTHTYWYASDGASYILVARFEAERPDGDPCPENIRRHLGNSEQLYCLVGPDR